MTDEEKRFDRREEARLDDMYDAQHEIDTAFNRWWNDDALLEDNPFNEDTPAFWAWEGWMAGRSAKREWQGLTDEEIHSTNGYEEDRSLYRFAHAIEAKLKEKNT